MSTEIQTYCRTLNRMRFLFVFFSLFVFTTAFGQKTILQGTVKQSDGSPLRNSAVMLVQYNPAVKTFSVVDSTYTDANGNYKFEGSVQYYILARPDEMAGGELPTYYGNSLFSTGAVPVSVNYGSAVTADFTTVKRLPANTGASSLGGTVLLGKNGGAISKITIFLADKDKNPIAVTATNASGKFEFKNLPAGNYYVWADISGVDNTAAESINLNALNPSKVNLHFRIGDGTLNCDEYNFSNIKDALTNKDNVYVLNLNSLQHEVAEKSLVIAPDGSKMLMLQVGDFSNLESLSLNINMINFIPAEIGKLGKLSRLSLNLNKLTSLPAEFSNLRNLQVLDIGKNNFNKFPDAVCALAALEELNFESNPVAALPSSINGLKNLRELNLSGCFDLLTLPPQIGELTNLETLDLSNCIKLKALPKELNNLKNLKVLDITGTKINPASFKKAVPGCEIRMTKK